MIEPPRTPLHGTISPWIASGVLGVALGIGLGFGLSAAHKPPPSPATANTTPNLAAPSVFAVSAPLEPGDKLPQLELAGWLNGSPPMFPQLQNHVVVLDVWANWCPVCHSAAPHLVEVFAKYQPLGVTFVSLTNDSREVALALADRAKITWHSGFGATLETMRNLGTFAGGPSGFNVKPLLLVIGRDGRIAWSDQHMRYRHQSESAIRTVLESAIEKSLEKSTTDDESE